MAIDMTSGTAGFATSDSYSAKPYLVEKYVDFAAVTTAKGSAIAQGDVIEVIDLPAGCYVMGAGFEVISAMTGTSTDATLDLGVTGGNVDAYVDGFDLDGASAGAFSAIPAASNGEQTLVTTADTLDLLVVTQTGTITGGELRVFALLLDVNGRDKPGLATAGS
jgi:allophanate hydrolase subunit 2